MTAEQMKNGDAVKYVLDNFKGYAEAARETALGPVQSLTMSLGDLAEEVGKVLMPMVQAAANVLKEFATWLQGLPPTVKTAIVVVGGLAAAVGPLSIGLGSILKMLPAIKVGLAALTGPIGLVTLAIGAATAAFIGFNESLRQASMERISARAKKYIEDGWSVDELKALREEALQKNLDAADRYQAASDRLNPLKSGSLSNYVLTFGENRREKIAARTDTAVYYEKVKAIDEAIQYLESVAPAIAVQGTGTTGGLSDLRTTSGLIGELTAKISDLEEAKKKPQPPRRSTT